MNSWPNLRAKAGRPRKRDHVLARYRATIARVPNSYGGYRTRAEFDADNSGFGFRFVRNRNTGEVFPPPPTPLQLARLARREREAQRMLELRALRGDVERDDLPF